MFGSNFIAFQLRQLIGKALQSTRSTWVLRRVFVPEPTPHGKVQRNPEELPNLMKLEVVENENKKPAGPLKVILLEDVEGVGHKFDVVDVARSLARSDLLLTRKAVYASPFDLEYYAKIKEEMALELAKIVRIPYEYICIGRELQSVIVPIRVSIENKWTGIDMLDDAIFFDDTITGPNFEIEATLVRFYLVMLTPEASRPVTGDQLAQYGIRQEEPYYSPESEIDEAFPVVDFMKKKCSPF